MRGARGRGLVPLQRLGANEPARSRRLTPRGLWRRGSCDGPRYKIFTWGSEHRNGGRGPTAVDVRTALGARRAPRPAPLPLSDHVPLLATGNPSCWSPSRSSRRRRVPEAAGRGGARLRHSSDRQDGRVDASRRDRGGPAVALSLRAAAAGPTSRRRPGSASYGACRRAGARCFRLANSASGWVGLCPAAGLWDRWAVRFPLVLMLVSGTGWLFGVSSLAYGPQRCRFELAVDWSRACT